MEEQQLTEKEAMHNKIFDKIEEIYQRKSKDGKPTGKNFVTHLIRAYMPVNKIHKLWDSKDKKLKCAITGHGLCTIDDAFKALNSEGMDAKLMEHLKATFNGFEQEHPLKKELKGRVLAYSGKDTDTAMCLDAVQAFIDWVQTKILAGDKHIHWVISDMRRKETINQVRQKLPDAADQAKIDKLEKISKKPQRATMALGDLAALKELQEKLKQQESENVNNNSK